MTEQQAFAAAIATAARTGDALPRLVYSDWLEENGLPTHADVLRRTAGLPWPTPAAGPAVSRIVMAARRLIESHPNVGFQQSIRGPIAEVVPGVVGWDLGGGRVGLTSAADAPLSLSRMIADAAAERDDRARQMHGGRFDSRADDGFRRAMGDLAALAGG